MIEDIRDIALSPLADPIMNAIFANVEVAGLAAESLVRVIFEADGEKAYLGKVVSTLWTKVGKIKQLFILTSGS